MTKFISWLLRLYRLSFRLKSISGAIFISRFVPNDVITSVEKLRWSKGWLLLPDSNKKFHKSELVVMNGSIDYISKASRLYDLTSAGIRQMRVMTVHNGKQVSVCFQNFDGYFAFEEVFEEELYDFFDQRDFIVLDVGMNIGTASLFFATYDNVKKIYSFEPFASTYQRALDNFKLNASLSSKINPVNYGLSDADKEIEVPYTYDGSLGASTSDFVISQQKAEASTRSERVRLKRADSIIKTMLEENPDCGIILKLDCEGAEYEILEDLYVQGTLNRISFFIIEWHFKGKQPLIALLEKAGFKAIAPNRPDREGKKEMGMIYAFKG